MVEADSLIVVGQPVGRQVVEDNPAAAWVKALTLALFWRQGVQVGGRGVDDGDAAGLAERGQRVGGLAVVQAVASSALVERRVVAGDGGDGMEDLLVGQAVGDHIEQQLLRDRACRQVLADQQLAEQQQALARRHLGQGRVWQPVAALDQRFAAARRLDVGVVIDQCRPRPR